MTPPKSLEERAFEFLEYDGEADPAEVQGYMEAVRLELQALRDWCVEQENIITGDEFINDYTIGRHVGIQLTLGIIKRRINEAMK